MVVCISPSSSLSVAYDLTPPSAPSSVAESSEQYCIYPNTTAYFSRAIGERLVCVFYPESPLGATRHRRSFSQPSSSSAQYGLQTICKYVVLSYFYLIDAYAWHLGKETNVASVSTHLPHRIRANALTPTLLPGSEGYI